MNVVCQATSNAFWLTPPPAAIAAAISATLRWPSTSRMIAPAKAGSGMAKGIQQGWPIVLSSLKSLLETGGGIAVFAKPKQAD